jgi:hypothetical protein
MKKIFKYLNLIIVILLYSCFSVAQVCYYSCGYTAENATSQYPSNTITGNYTGSFTTVNSCIYGGEYQVYQVEQGAYYEWSYWSADGANVNGDLMALSLYDIFANELVYNIFCSNSQTKLVWAATFTGEVVLLNNNVSSDALGNLFCDTNQTCHTLRWRQLPQPSNSTLVPYTGNNTVIIDCSHQTNLYDYSGNGHYLDNLDGYTVLANNGSGIISISGDYSTELGYDYIRIYAGVGTTGSLLATYSGEGTINYVGASGQSLTVRFSSDGGIVSSGFALSVTYLSTTPSAPTSITGNSTACSGSTTALSVNGTLSSGASWIWYRNSCGGTYVGTGSSITVNPTSTTTYYVRAEGSCNNVSSCVSKTITITTSPSISISTPNTAICSGSSANLSASVANGASGCTIQWQRSTTGTSNWTNVGTNATTYATGALTTPYYYRATYTCTACSNPATSNTLQITVSAAPNPPALSSATYCQGSTATALNANDSNISGETFAWNTGSTASSITPSTTTVGTTTYTVTVTKSGCSTTRSATITVSATPTINAATSSCNGGVGTVTITASGGSGLSYKLGNTTQPSNIFNNVSNGTYTVTVTNNNNCSATANVTVNCNACPTASLTNNGPACAGTNVTLTAQPNLYTGITVSNYQWNNGASNNGTVSVANTGTYTVTISYSNGCTATATTSVVINPTPTPTITANPSNSTVCSGSSITLSANGGYNAYTWSNGGGSASTATYTNLSSATTYTVTVTNNNGCTATATKAITVIPSPTVAPIVGNVNVCVGSPATYTNSTPGGIWSNNNTAIGSISPSGVFTATTTGSATIGYQVSVGGCTTNATKNITVVPVPTATIAGSNAICSNQSVTLTASGGSSYQWNSDLGTSPTITQTPIATTIYAVTVTNANGCTATDTHQVMVTSLPAVSAPSNQIVCAGTNTTPITFSGTAGATFNWTNNAPSIGLAASGSGNIAAFTAINTGASPLTATITVTPTISGCSGTPQTCTITVNASPSVTINATDTGICLGENVTLTASSASNYQWSENWGATQSITISPTIATTYTVTVTGTNTCTATASKSIMIYNTPNADITTTGNTTFCQGDNPTLTASSGATYTWSSGQTTATCVPANSNTYTVTVTNSFGCSQTASIDITAIPLPNNIITIDENQNPQNNDNYVCKGNNVELSVVNSPTANYLWNTNATTNLLNMQPSNDATYTIIITDLGCTATNSVTIIVLEKPTISIEGDLEVCEGTNATITASGGSNYQWSNSISNTSATITLYNTGVYTVTVTSDNGCSSSHSLNITQLPVPSANFTILQNGLRGIIVGNNSTNYTHVFWDFGDGSSSQENSTFHTYQTDGDYTITLIAANAESCYDTITQNISIPNIIYNPKLSLYPNPNDGFFTLNFVADCDCFLIIDIFDLLGRFVSREIKETTVGLNQLGFNQSQLPQGVYAVGIYKADKNEYVQQFDVGLFSKTKLKYNLWSKLVKY